MSPTDPYETDEELEAIRQDAIRARRHPLFGGIRGLVPHRRPGVTYEPARARTDARDGTEVDWGTEKVTFPARVIQSKTEETPC